MQVLRVGAVPSASWQPILWAHCWVRGRGVLCRCGGLTVVQVLRVGAVPSASWQPILWAHCWVRGRGVLWRVVAGELGVRAGDVCWGQGWGGRCAI